MSESNGDVIYDEMAEPKSIKGRGPDGTVHEYTVHESSGGPAYWKWLREYQTVLPDRDEKDTDQEYGQKVLNSGVSLDAIQTDLIVLCVRLDNKPIDRPVVEAWGMKFRNMVFGLCKEVNGDTKKEVEKEGKDLGTETMDGSGSLLHATSPQQ